MAQVTLKQLLEAGVHFGHQTSRWNPKMKKYIFGERNGIYIINLEITLTCLQRFLDFLRQVAASGSEVLFVGTKKQAQIGLREAAESCEMPYVNQRWLGGMLTNFETVRKSVKRLEEIEKLENEGGFRFITKKEGLELKKEHEKLSKNLMGVRNMRRLPGAIFVIDSNKEMNAVLEGIKLGIPIAAVLDTNCDPDLIDYPIPGNDDAIRAIKLFCDLSASAIREGREKFRQGQSAAVVPAEVSEPVAVTPAGESVVPTEGEAAAGEVEDGKAAVEPDDSVEEKLAERFGVPKAVPEVKESKILKVKKPLRKEPGRAK